MVTPLAKSLGETVAAVVALQKEIIALEAALKHEKDEREADALMTGQLLARIATLENELRTAQEVANALDEALQAAQKRA